LKTIPINISQLENHTHSHGKHPHSYVFRWVFSDLPSRDISVKGSTWEICVVQSRRLVKIWTIDIPTITEKIPSHWYI
jgi:hypothetical protein